MEKGLAVRNQKERARLAIRELRKKKRAKKRGEAEAREADPFSSLLSGQFRSLKGGVETSRKRDLVSFFLEEGRTKGEGHSG